LVAGIVPGVERQPLKKLKTDENALLSLLNRWRDEAVRSGHKVSRIAVAFEVGRDGFWLARWLKARGIEAHVIHASSVAVYFGDCGIGCCSPRIRTRYQREDRAGCGNLHRTISGVSA
jgi:hypothetical protein